jgi:hypothetical protein
MSPWNAEMTALRLPELGEQAESRESSDQTWFAGLRSGRNWRRLAVDCRSDGLAALSPGLRADMWRNKAWRPHKMLA